MVLFTAQKQIVVRAEIRSVSHLINAALYTSGGKFKSGRTRHFAMKQITTKLHVQIVTDCLNRKVIFIQFHSETGPRMPKMNENLKICQYAVKYGPSKLLNNSLHTEMHSTR